MLSILASIFQEPSASPINLTLPCRRPPSRPSKPRRRPTSVAEDVGVAADHLVVDSGDHVGNIEGAGFQGQIGVKQDLQQQVAEFFGQFAWIAFFQGVENLVSLLDQVGFQGCMGLLAVPGATTRGAQASLDVDQGFEEVSNRLAGWFLSGCFRGAGMSARRL